MAEARSRRRAGIAPFLAIAAPCLAAMALLAGCASESARRDSDLAQIDRWLPGRYDNQAQIAADRRAGRPPHEALALAVVPVDALQMGHHVFYVEEAAGAAGSPRAPHLILAQHLVSIDVVKGKVVAALYSFTDPPRWREGATTPELFTALQPQDVKLMQGCEITFAGTDGASGPRGAAPDRPSGRATADHPAGPAPPGTFIASDDPTECVTTSPVTGAVEPMQIRVELRHDEIAVSVRSGDAGIPLADDAYTRFRRSGGP